MRQNLAATRKRHGFGVNPACPVFNLWAIKNSRPPIKKTIGLRGFLMTAFTRIGPLVFAALLAGSALAPGLAPALACTRTLFVGDDNTVITGRNMDWEEDMHSNLYLFPAGIKRDGAPARSP
jgi:hypothetical protein